MDFYNDIDVGCCAWLKSLIEAGLIPQGVVDGRSIKEVRAADLAGHGVVHLFAGIGGWPLALSLAGWQGPVWTCSCPCFPSETLVMTDRGQVPIEDVTAGDMVLTHEARFRRVLRTGSQPGELVRIRGQGHHGMLATPNHPFYARGVRKDYRRWSEDYGKVLLAESEWVAAADLKGQSWATVASVPAMPIPPFGEKDWSGKRPNLPDDPESNGFARFLGYWVGDGWVRDDVGGVVLCGGHKDDALLQGLADGAGLTGHKTRERTGWRMRLGSKLLSEWLTSEFGCGAAGKRIPVWLHGRPPAFRAAFLEGWMLADGHQEKAAKGGGDVSVLTTVSKALAIGARILMNQAGVSASIMFKKTNRICVIEGRTVREQGFYRVVGYEKTRSFKFDGAHGWGRVRSVEPVAGTRRVYNLEVEGDNTYVADGIVVHNCQPFSSAGKRGGAGDPRHLWPDAFRLIGECRPATVFGEQVDSADGLRWLAGIQADMESAGFAFGFAVLPAAGVAAPHGRHRLFWVGESERRGGDGVHERIEPGHLAPDAGGDGQGTVPGPAPGSPWSDFRIVPCGDGKARRVSPQPGDEPLAHGIPFKRSDPRLGLLLARLVELGHSPEDSRRLVREARSNRIARLRGYGNSICPQVAALFVWAYMQARGLT